MRMKKEKKMRVQKIFRFLQKLRMEEEIREIQKELNVGKRIENSFVVNLKTAF